MVIPFVNRYKESINGLFGQHTEPSLVLLLQEANGKLSKANKKGVRFK